MEGKVVNTKRIAKNTVILYFRMIVLMAVSLYTTRITLEALGVEDYGIYNVIGSVVSLFSFLNGSLSSASNRFFSIELGNNDYDALHKSFCTNINCFGLLTLVSLALLETGGIWYINKVMVIPHDRLFAANIVYQCTLLSFACTLLVIPYQALIIAHEKMSAFAYFSIIEAIAKLLIAFYLIYNHSDALIVYGILLSLLSIVIFLVYFLYSHSKFKESHYMWYWNKKEIIELVSFSGWHFLGTTSIAIKTQGVNILINAFYNPAINAARAVAFQVESALIKFSDGYFTATKPQLYKAYAAGHRGETLSLIDRSTIICTILMATIMFPVLFNSEFIISLWLKNVPDHTILFLQLVLVDGILTAMVSPVMLATLASGNIKFSQIGEFFLRVLNLPACYILLKIGVEPEYTVAVSIFFNFIGLIARPYFLKRVCDYFTMGKYLILEFKIIAVLILTYLLVVSIGKMTFSPIIWFLISSSVSLTAMYLLTYALVLTKQDRASLLCYIGNIKSKINI